MNNNPHNPNSSGNHPHDARGYPSDSSQNGPFVGRAVHGGGHPAAHPHGGPPPRREMRPPHQMAGMPMQAAAHHHPSFVPPTQGQRPRMGYAQGQAQLPVRHHAPPTSPTPTRQQQSAAWSVPNPLASRESPSTSMRPQVPQRPPSQQSYQRPVAATLVRPSAGAASASGTSSNKPRVVLSDEARQALAQAIWSAIRSPDGSIAPEAMARALAAGLPQHAVMNAARVAREREALKRKGLAAEQAKREQHARQQRAAQQQQQAQAQAQALQFKRQQQAAHQQQQQRVRPVPPPAAAPAAPSSRLVAAPSKATSPTPATTTKASLASTAKVEERNNWRRVQSGLFMTQKGRYLALPNSIVAMSRTTDNRTVLPVSSRKRPRSDLIRQAASVQARLKQQSAPASFVQNKTSSLDDLSSLDPETFKRIKMEPKRVAKALDRSLRKTRQTTAEALIKQHKELSKAILSHQSDFLKYHRQRRTDAYRLAKAVRDSLDKAEKKKEKDADQAERARLAALRANDMQAYSKLLEETKNDRLKFLLDKTDDCIRQISSLLQKRSIEDQQSAEFASASAASSGSYYASAHLKTEDVRQPSILVGGDLKEYQVSGLQWMVSLYNNKLSGILADEMGLGKTIQAISLLAYLMEFKDNLGPYLVIVPLSTMSNWVNEFHKWCPSARLVAYKGTPAQRKELYKDQVRNGQFNVLLTTYEYIIRDKSSLRKIEWQYAIVDEGHRMKNAQSKFAVTLGTQYTTHHRILLTGTPLQNSLPELWALLNFLLPTIFSSVESFDDWFNRPFAHFGTSGSSEEKTDQMLTNEERMLIIHRLHELIRPFMLRRVKSEVLDQLPEKVEKVLRCDLSSWQKELYKQISVKAAADKSLVGNGLVEPQAPTRGMNNVVMQLRKVCNHPYLFSPEGYHINENIIRSSGKMELLDRMLPKLKAAGHRVLLFTQMTAVMSILEDYFAYRGYASLRLDGSTPAEEREKRMYKFNAPDSPYFIFCLSTRAGGLGLNLATANVVIIFDSDWNPMADLQAQDRAHRIGQRSDVSVFRLITNSPVEEKILSRATEKLNMSELVVEAGKFDKSSVEKDNSLERKRMMEVLLSDFDASTPATRTSEPTESEIEATDADDDAAASQGSSDDENLNELISNNEADFDLYTAMDHDPQFRSAGLFTKEEEIPDWIKYPQGRGKNGAAMRATDLGGPRKRAEVSYDDGLTEKQFVRLMDKQYDAEQKEAAASKKRKAAKISGGGGLGAPPARSEQLEEGAGPPGTMTEWTFRKLISATKAVIALKDPTTKRRLSDVFLEKPCNQTYPDYYEIIEKPIAINDILRKCRGHLYGDLQEYRDDWKLLFSNARKFNGEDSWVTADAAALEKELGRVLKKSGFDEPPPPPKRKPLRIKLSLKSLKTSPPTEEATAPEAADDAVSPAPAAKSKPKRKRSQKKAKGKKKS